MKKILTSGTRISNKPERTTTQTSVSRSKRTIVTTLFGVVAAGMLLLPAAARADSKSTHEEQAAYYKSRIGTDAPREDRNPSTRPELFQPKSEATPARATSPIQRSVKKVNPGNKSPSRSPS